MTVRINITYDAIRWTINSICANTFPQTLKDGSLEFSDKTIGHRFGDPSKRYASEKPHKHQGREQDIKNNNGGYLYTAKYNQS